MKIPKRVQRYIIETQTYSFKEGPVYMKVLAFIYKLLGRKLLARLLITTKDCNTCKGCSKICPQLAIGYVFNNPVRNNKCKGCLMCVYYCPNQAIELPLSILIGAFLFLFIPYEKIILNLLPFDLPTAPYILDLLLSLVLWSIGYLITIYTFRKLSFLISTLPFSKKIRENPFIKNIHQKIHPLRVFPVLVRK